MTRDAVILCVLAGGKSSRFRASSKSGESKLNLRVGDAPVLSWLLQRLGPALAREHRPVHFWLNLAPGMQPPAGASCFERWVVDTHAYAGPMIGMRSVLREACGLSARSRVVFVGVDAPAISPALVTRFLRRSMSTTHAIAVMGARVDDTGQRSVEPLPSVWQAKSGLALLDQAMLQNVRGPSRLTTRAGVVLESIPALDESGYVNINEMRDMKEASRVLGRTVRVSS